MNEKLAERMLARAVYDSITYCTGRPPRRNTALKKILGIAALYLAGVSLLLIGYWCRYGT